MQNVNSLKFVIISLFLMSFIPTGYAYDPINLACLNDTALNVSDGTNHFTQLCAWGCYQGECLDGVALGFNGLLMLSLFWVIGIGLILIGTNINAETYGLIKGITYAFGVFFLFAGIFGFLNVYEKSAGIGDIIKNISVVLVQGIPYSLVALFLIYILYWLFNKLEDSIKDSKGLP